MKTNTKYYSIWYDGDVEISNDQIEKYIAKVPVGKLYVQEMTDVIRQYNLMLPKSEKISTKVVAKPLDMSWNIPTRYQHLDLHEYLIDKLDKDGITDNSELMLRIKRVRHELAEYKRHNLTDVLRCLIYIIDVFEEHDVVWGVGRGSSVSSYVLYLIGVHDIDSVLFHLPFTDFIKA